MRRYVNMAKSGRMAATRRAKPANRPPLRNDPSDVGGKGKRFPPGGRNRRRG
ncbi:MAG TPA: hypothetical protein VKF61_03275 [Candidatus Polarisedimenticolia bacterium]|nr:hypothetical protein [Candidatus Polarisedimenticolia bacterium]